LLTNHCGLEKTVYQLIIEVEDILRKERKANTPTKRQLEQVKKGNKNLRDTAKKRDQKISSLEKDKQVMQQTITDLESSNKPSSDWDQKLKDKEESLNSLKQEINALKRSSGLFDMLVQLKNNEIGLLRKDNQRLGNLEQENRDLKRRLESLSSVDSNPTNIRIKTEEDELAPCKVGNKKRRTDS
jgi:chromosome segregation ATPase